jgi:hypothetical protein
MASDKPQFYVWQTKSQLFTAYDVKWVPSSAK